MALQWLSQAVIPLHKKVVALIGGRVAHGHQDHPSTSNNWTRSVTKENHLPIPQYSLGKIMTIWMAAAIPMAILGWFVAPMLAQNSSHPVHTRVAVLTAGLVWQFVLVVLLLYRETGTFQLSILRQRLWLGTPRSRRTGEPSSRLWWWIAPVLLTTAAFEMAVGGMLDELWTTALPFLAEPQGFSFQAVFAPQARSQLVGAWGFYGLFLLMALFNTFLGEELLFRGLLLPRMSGVFRSRDWMANGVLFGLYHLHQPWMMVSGMIVGMFCFALPSRYFRSSWFGVIAHSGQSILFAILALGVVLGLAE